MPEAVKGASAIAALPLLTAISPVGSEIKTWIAQLPAYA